jgi:hypothetical protein
MTVLRTEERLGEGDWGLTQAVKRRRCPGYDAGSLLELPNLLEQRKVCLGGFVEGALKVFIPPFQSLDFQALPLSRRLGGTAVAEDALDPALFLFVLGLGTFPINSLASGAPKSTERVVHTSEGGSFLAPVIPDPMTSSS